MAYLSKYRKYYKSELIKDISLIAFGMDSPFNFHILREIKIIMVYF